jgi:phosphate:Na+ symporter
MTPAAPTIELGSMLTQLGGGLALFLYGMRRMTEALKTVAGGGMKNLLAKLTSNRFSATLAGIVVTAVIQSSSVTTVLVVGFAVSPSA